MILTLAEVTIYTDGACSGNPGPGGWGAVILNQQNKLMQNLSGSEPNTTNNRMELTATIKALEFVLTNMSYNTKVTLFTDSKYSKDGITSWIHKWKLNNWRTSNNKEVKNQDLWQILDDLVSNLHITWKWVKGHDGNVYNEMADQLARKECE